MRDVSIIGIGQTPVGEHWDKSLKDLAAEAIQNAIKDARWNASMRSSRQHVFGHAQWAGAPGRTHQRLVGLRGVEAVKIEAACGSGAAALRLGYVAVAGELADFVVVAGVEKMTDRQAIR